MSGIRIGFGVHPFPRGGTRVVAVSRSVHDLRHTFIFRAARDSVLVRALARQSWVGCLVLLCGSSRPMLRRSLPTARRSSADPVGAGIGKANGRALGVLPRRPRPFRAKLL